MTNPFVSLEQAAAQMHRGAGPESLIQDAGAWGVVAQKLETAAEEILSVSTRCDEQYWQGPAAQQARDALTSVTQELKHNAVVAGQIETAATTVAAAFNKARAATATPDQVEFNRWQKEMMVLRGISKGVPGLYAPAIAAFDANYETMWLESIVAHDTYYHDTSHALARVKQTWSPHQQPAGTPTTARDHPPTPDAPDIPAQITQHHDTAAWARLYALSHAIDTIKHQKEYEQQSTYAKMCEGLADHGKATVELCNKMAQHHKQAAQLYRGQANIPTLAHKCDEIAATLKQTQQHMKEKMEAHYFAGTAQPHLQKIEKMVNELSSMKSSLEKITLPDAFTTSISSMSLEMGILSRQVSGHLGLPDLGVTFNDIRQQQVGEHEWEADRYASIAARIQGWARNSAEEADNAWRAARQHAQSITDHAHDFFVFFQTATRTDDQATTLAGSSA